MFCCVVSLSIFMNCAVLWRARWASQNTNNESNSPRYYTTKRLIRDYPTCQNVMSIQVHLTDICLWWNVWQKYAKWNGIGTKNPAKWLVNSRKTWQTAFCGFNKAITDAIYFTFHNGGKKSSFDRHQFKFFTLSVKKKMYRRKETCPNFFRNFNPIGCLLNARKPILTSPLEYK